jgi:VanZ family protein
MPVLLGMKVVHLLEYGLLAILWNRGLRKVTAWSACAVGLASVAVTFGWGISDEIHQSFVPGRTARVEDALTNLVAAVAATWLWRLANAARQPR